MTRDEMIKKFMANELLKNNPNKEKINEVIKMVVEGLKSGVSEQVIKKQVNQYLN